MRLKPDIFYINSMSVVMKNPLHTLRVVSLLLGFLLLLKQLLAHFVRNLVCLFTEERLDGAVYARDEPQQGVDEINPDGNLHQARAAALVRVVAIPSEKDAGENSKGNDPQDEKAQVPGKDAIGLGELDLAPDVRDGAEGRSCEEEDRRGSRGSSHNNGKDPLRREASVGVVICIDAVAVEAAGDEGEEELQAAAHKAWYHLERLEPCLAHRLACFSALVEGMTASLAAQLRLVCGAELGGGVGEALDVAAQFDGGLAGLDGGSEFTHGCRGIKESFG